MKNIKSEKGMITMLVLISVLFLVTFLISAYLLISNKLQNQEEVVAETKRIYEGTSTMEEVYDSLYNDLNVLDYIKVGDYVNYTPQNNITKYSFEDKYTGYTGNADADGVNDDKQELTKESLNWRILNINNDGTIDLISENPTNSSVYFSGALGYNNAVYLLNDYCRTLYSNEEYGAVGRSINIEDIQDKMNLEVWDYHTFAQGGAQYGRTKTHTSNLNYPYQWTQEKSEGNAIDGNLTKGTLSTSEQKELTEETYETAKTSITMTQNFWRPMTNNNTLIEDNFKTVDIRNKQNDNTFYYNLFKCKTAYWLASRFNGFYDTYSSLGIFFYKNTSGPEGYRMMTTNLNIQSHPCYIRPVVTVMADRLDISTNYSAVGKWELKS